jgi:hypothetical protein
MAALNCSFGLHPLSRCRKTKKISAAGSTAITRLKEGQKVRMFSPLVKLQTVDEVQKKYFTHCITPLLENFKMRL